MILTPYFFDLRRRHIRLLAEQADDHADGEMAFDGDAADGIDRIEKAGVLHHQHRLVAGGVKPAAHRNTFVFFADLHDMIVRIGEQAL